MLHVFVIKFDAYVALDAIKPEVWLIVDVKTLKFETFSHALVSAKLGRVKLVFIGI